MHRRTPLAAVLAALAAAALFGVSAPLAKRLLGPVGPLWLAGLLYLGAGIGLALVGLVQAGSRAPREARLRAGDLGLLAGIIGAGGVVAPILLLLGLERVSGVAGSLLLTLETPFTVLLAVVLFGEHLGRRAAGGTAFVAAGALLLAYAPAGGIRVDRLGVLAICGACLAWALDNNLTQRLSLRDPIAIARTKAFGAAAITLSIPVVAGLAMPGAVWVLLALGLGFVSYGISLVLTVRAMRVLGAARQAALFATAPLAGAVAAVPLLGETVGAREVIAGTSMIAGVLLLLREHHEHLHDHEPLVHDHAHVHDEHHPHDHGESDAGTEPHAHPHEHLRTTHAHPHLPDLHHRHGH